MLAPLTAQSYKYPEIQAPLDITTAPDITVFAIQNSVVDTLFPTSVKGFNYNCMESCCPDGRLNSYIVPGQVLYSTNLTDGFLTARMALLVGEEVGEGGGAPLVVTTNSQGDVLVNDSWGLQSDILSSNGVVHVVERRLYAY